MTLRHQDQSTQAEPRVDLQRISGALILFAGIFNLFQAVLSLLLSGGRSRN